MIDIRPLTFADYKDYRYVWGDGLVRHPTAFRLWAAEVMEWKEKKWRELFDTAQHYGAYAGDKLVGIVGIEQQTARKCRHIALLSPVYVLPEARRTGLARRLIESAIAGLPAEVEQVILELEWGNEAAHNLYASMGFASAGHIPRAMKMPDGSYIDDEIMVKILRK